MQPLAIVNQQTVVPVAEVQAVTAALQEQLSRDFTPAWRLAAKLRVVDDPGAVVAGEWSVYLFGDTADVPDALAWHTEDAHGSPVGIVPILRALQYGVAWSGDLAHEVLEMLPDPFCNRAVFAPFRGQQTWVMEEVCDPVEGDSYSVNGVSLSNFVLPSWFRAGGRWPFDQLRKLRYPLSMTPGGYVSYWDAAAGSWANVLARQVHQRHVEPALYSRRWRRQRRGP